jgi:TetR/AcrR family transcriptional regulator
MVPTARGDRRIAILEALASELERDTCTRITTARLAQVVGVSEAALYRHFPSKARMYEALIEFAEDSVFGLLGRVVGEQQDTRARLQALLGVTLGFAARNPGITRLLLGDALVGEHERLRERVARFFERIETQIRQILRDGELRDDARVAVPASAAARTLLAVIEGSMARFVRSRFRESPEEDLETLRTALVGALLRAPAAGD